MADYSDHKDYIDAREYLLNGGYGEVIGLTLVALEAGAPKVQLDTFMALALLDMAGPVATHRPSASPLSTAKAN